MSDVRTPQINQWVVAGNLTGDPERVQTQSGKTVIKFCIANTQHFRRDGQADKDTSFIDVEYWQSYPDRFIDAMVKGAPVLVVGKAKQDTWEDKNTGQKRSKIKLNAMKIEPLSWGNSDGDESTHQPTSAHSSPAVSAPTPEDDIPF